MCTGQGKPDQPTRYLELTRNYHGWAVLTLVDGKDRASIHVPLSATRQALDFAELLAETAELVLVSELRGR